MIDIEATVSRLELINPYGLRIAIDATARANAHAAMVAARVVADRVLTLRSTYTKRSIQFDHRRGSMEARMGSTLDYMSRLEFGGTHANPGPLPTSASTSTGMGTDHTRRQLPRLRLPRLRIAPRDGRDFNIPRQVANAQRQNHNVIISRKRGGKKGIFLIKDRGRRVEMIYDLSRDRIQVSQKRWMRVGVDQAMRLWTLRYAEALQFQLNRM